MHAEPGCLLYAIHDADDGTITMIEKWESVADLDAHGSGPAVAALQAATDDLVTGAGDRRPDDADPGRATPGALGEL